MPVPVALTIAGSDSGGGAGIQADLKSFSALGVYGASVITALTAQNTRGVFGVHAVPADFVAAQIAAVLDDIAVDAVKLGMLANAAVIEAVIDGLRPYPALPIVLDPVMIATSGDRLLAGDAVDRLRDRLMPMAALVTPNLAEAAALLGEAPARDEDAMARQAEALVAAGAKAVLVKGGHGTGDDSVDILLVGGAISRFASPRVATRNTHGTGCTLSAAIAAELARGATLPEAVQRAKTFVGGAIASADDLAISRAARAGRAEGHGPTHHFHALWR